MLKLSNLDGASRPIMMASSNASETSCIRAAQSSNTSHNDFASAAMSVAFIDLSITNANGVSICPPSRIKASQRRKALSVGKTPTPRRVNNPATTSAGRQSPATQCACNSGSLMLISKSTHLPSLYSGIIDRETTCGTTSSTNPASIQNEASSSSVRSSIIAAGTTKPAQYPCGLRAAAAMRILCSVLSKQYPTLGCSTYPEPDAMLAKECVEFCLE
mmetsp:Transcript_6349/g.22945  ORF Transcript_6349/g.22945 Transcript_6349/m.22945 type:complete len:217 (-) Transcript_6349:1021-1671(-)